MDKSKIIIISVVAGAVGVTAFILIIVGVTGGFTRCITKDPRMTTNYCRKDLCYPGVKHIGCAHCMEFAWKCKKPEIEQLSPELIKVIVDKHNEYRNKIASGGLPPFTSAERMLTLKWHDELAFLAELNVRQCKMVHDQCRNTDTLPFTGQNGFWSKRSPPLDEEYLSGAVKFWFNEYSDTKVSDIESFPSEDPPKPIGHFTSMMLDKNAYVGCGVSTYMTGSNEALRDFLIMCNYGYANMVGDPVYKAGVACSKCTKCNPLYPALCSVDEAVDAT